MYCSKCLKFVYQTLDGGDVCYQCLHPELVPIKVGLTEDGKKVVVTVNDIKIELFEQQVNELIKDLEKKKMDAKIRLNGWIAVA